MSTQNPTIEAIQQSVRFSYQALNRLIDDQLAHVEVPVLYQVPAPGEWTIMQNLAHINEFMPYWADEIAQLVASPGKNFGRTATDEGRLRALREHATDTLEQAKAQLPDSCARLEQVLSMLQDNDLLITGHHPRYGEKTLAWFIEDFVTSHLINHLAQMKTDLATSVRHPLRQDE